MFIWNPWKQSLRQGFRSTWLIEEEFSGKNEWGTRLEEWGKSNISKDMFSPGIWPKSNTPGNSGVWVVPFSPSVLYPSVYQLLATECPSPPEGRFITYQRRWLPLADGNSMQLWAISNQYLEKLSYRCIVPWVYQPGSGNPKTSTMFPFLFFIQGNVLLAFFFSILSNSLFTFL